MSNSSDKLIDEAKKYLEGHLCETMSLVDMAQSLGVSRFHLARKFKSATSQTPGQFHLAKRIDKAKALLSEGKTLKEAAAALGFADPCHFSRQFSRIVGITPGQFRQRRSDHGQ